jgi:hypothetical protein
MSHITTVENDIKIKSETILKAALNNLKTVFPAGTFQGKAHEAITFEQIAPDVIKCRYAPIEVYQKNGNLQFVKDPVTGEWKMQLDHWNCSETVTKVKDAFFVAYQQNPITQFYSSQGYMVTEHKEGKTTVLVAVKY